MKSKSNEELTFEVIDKETSTNWVMNNILQAPVTGILFAGDRMSCVDETVVAKIRDQIVGIATIAPKGEGMTNQPTIVGEYVLKEFRSKGIATKLLIETVKRCEERDLENIRLDIISKRFRDRVYNNLSDDIKDKLDMHDMSFNDIGLWDIEEGK